MIVLYILLVVLALAVIALVLLQSGKSHGLSGTIAGGAETFFGKTQSKQRDAILGKITTALAIVFVVIVVFLYVIQPDYIPNANPSTGIDDVETEGVTEADAGEATEAATDAATEAATDAATDAQ